MIVGWMRRGRTDCKTPTLLPTPRVWFVVVACTRYSHCWNVKFIWRATDVPSACSERLCSMEAASKLCGATGLWATRQPAVQNNKVLTNKQLKWNGVKDKVSAAAAVWTLRVCVFFRASSVPCDLCCHSSLYRWGYKPISIWPTHSWAAGCLEDSAGERLHRWKISLYANGEHLC